MKVYLLGAGPGDPGLLTVKARDILAAADVVVYDYLASPAFLALARPEAEIIYVGKKGGDHTLSQGEINALLIEKAQQGKVVARLKGGDPYVFGRGAEEAEELIAAGLDYEVVPGVTSGVAGLAYAGIPVTHRKHASSVSFITGHEDPTKEASALPWEHLAKSASTLVFYMGMKNLPSIAANLVAAGLPGETPAALVHWGTTCRHRSLVATLETLHAKGTEAGFTAPSLIVVGDVVMLHDTLNHFERKPLLGKGIVVTRAREQASSILQELTALGACVIEFPTIAITPIQDMTPVHEAVEKLHNYDWLVFTSVNGVKWFFHELYAMGMDTRALAGVTVAAIGPATAKSLECHGIRPDFVPEQYVAESVVAGMLDRGVAGKRILIPRAKEAREVLPEELRKAGAEVEILPVYETTLAESGPDVIRNAIKEGRLDCITFASSSTVENFFALVSPEMLRTEAPQAQLACIGPVTAQTLEGYGFQPHIQPKDYTIPALVRSIVQAFSSK